MFKDKYKRDNEKINVNPETIKKLSERMKYNIESDKVINIKRKNSDKYILAVACLLFIMIPTIIGELKYGTAKNNELANNIQNSMDGSSNKNEAGKEDNISNVEEENKIINEEKSEVKSEEETGYYIPEIGFTMPSENMYGCMVGFIVYNNRLYDQCGTTISIEEAKNLKGEKIGVTKDIYGSMEGKKSQGEKFNINEVEDLVSSIGGAEVYKVKGYDEKFRIMTYIEDEYGIRADIYECLTGITISSGKDIFGKMNIENNIKSVKYDTFDNWNYNTPDKKDILIDENVSNFISSLNESIPYSLEEKEFRDSFFNKENDNYDEQQAKQQQKFLYLELKDSISIEFRLFSNGYVYYKGMNGTIFKIDDTTFNNLWDILVEQ